MGFEGPKTPLKYFLDNFMHLFILFGLSAFQRYLTFYFAMIFRDFMKPNKCNLPKLQKMYNYLKKAETFSFHQIGAYFV